MTTNHQAPVGATDVMNAIIETAMFPLMAPTSQLVHTQTTFNLSVRQSFGELMK